MWSPPLSTGLLIMSSLRSLSLLLALCAVVLAGCATRPISAPRESRVFQIGASGNLPAAPASPVCAAT
jgi:hypothetical protein